jgi:hypothetical protein
MSSSTNDLAVLRLRLARRHHLVGWVGLLVFLSLGAALEGFHGFKASFYLDQAHRLRREMWTLAHAHGTLLALVHVAFAAGVVQFGQWTAGRLKLTSFFLLDAAVLIPVGFFLGGLTSTQSDPGWGVVLVPAGALLLAVAVSCVVWSAAADLRLGETASAPEEAEPPV